MANPSGLDFILQGLQQGAQGIAKGIERRGINERQDQIRAQQAAQRKQELADARAQQEKDFQRKHISAKAVAPLLGIDTSAMSPGELQAFESSYLPTSTLSSGIASAQKARQKTLGTPLTPAQQRMVQRRGFLDVFSKEDLDMRLAFDKVDRQKGLDLTQKEDNLRKEIGSNKVVKEANDTITSYGNFLMGASRGDAVGDLAMIFNFMKTLDPGSVVRESEFRSAAQARGAMSRLEEAGVPIPAFLAQSVNRLGEGGALLLPEQRLAFVDTAKGQAQQNINTRDQFLSRYSDIAQRRGLNPQNILPTTRLDTEENIKLFNKLKGINNGGPPEVGFEDGGYRFKGGDPANRKNWVKI